MSETTPTLLADRALIRVAGDNPRDFLQGLVTQDVVGLDASAPRWGGLLTPQGKALFDFLLWSDGDAVLIDCEARSAEALTRRLSMYRLRRAITIAPAIGGVHWSLRHDAPPDPRLPDLGFRWIGDANGAPADAAWRAHRLAFGVTEGVEELGSDRTLWLECNARELNGVSFTKGCYIGQENTARMHHRAKVNRRLVVAPIAEAGDRTLTRYADLGLMVELRRVESLGDAIRPAWLDAALADAPSA
jgi:folate-binding protein YgfZ